MHGQGGDYIQTISIVLIWKPSNGRWHGKIYLQLIGSEENQQFYACGDKNKIRSYVNTPATAKLAIPE